MVNYPDPGPLPKHLNYTYKGHTSEIFPTPWPYEGRKTVGVPRDQVRFPPGQKTFKELKEFHRLAAIENPGRCRSRRRHTDAWCRNKPIPGLTRCRWHCVVGNNNNTVTPELRARGQANLEKQRAATKAAEIIRRAQRK